MTDITKMLRESRISMLLEKREEAEDHDQGFDSFALDGDLDAALGAMSLVDDSRSPLATQMSKECEVRHGGHDSYCEGYKCIGNHPLLILFML
jgi:hypothetical protein